MQSHIGLLTRQNVKVNIKSWREVTQGMKEQIRESVKVSIIYVNAINKFIHIYVLLMIILDSRADKLQCSCAMEVKVFSINEC